MYFFQVGVGQGGIICPYTLNMIGDPISVLLKYVTSVKIFVIRINTNE